MPTATTKRKLPAAAKKPVPRKTATAAKPGNGTKVTLNVPVKVSTRSGLAKLKARHGLSNQGEVLDKLVREALAAK